ncbi:MAG: 50S ribosomal protein L21 [Bacillota bacterium]|nr:50S ribosomal protein L21 [Bacillota bacterium]
MYAIIETGGKQYRVAQGDVVEVERLSQEEGSPVTFDRVLLVADGEKVQVGDPFLAGIQVKGILLGQTKGDKIIVFKYRAKTNYRRKLGHRQPLSRVRIESIEG